MVPAVAFVDEQKLHSQPICISGSKRSHCHYPLIKKQCFQKSILRLLEWNLRYSTFLLRKRFKCKGITKNLYKKFLGHIYTAMYRVFDEMTSELFHGTHFTIFRYKRGSFGCLYITPNRPYPGYGQFQPSCQQTPPTCPIPPNKPKDPLAWSSDMWQNAHISLKRQRGRQSR
jgi:hypothetical protein